MTEQERFERWAEDRGFNLDKPYLNPSEYEYIHTNYSWLAWQAALESREQES